jgi:hypothetical protein
MAFAAIKPQLVIPIAGWLMLWSFGDWQRRRKYALAFALTLGGLLAASEWILPGWVGRFRDAVVAYRAYTGGAGSLLDTLMSPALGRAAALLIAGIVFVVCWKSRRASSSEAGFLGVTSLVLTATVVIVPMIAPYNQVLLLPTLMILAAQWSELRRGGALVRVLAWGSVVLIAWPWVASAILTALSAFMAPEQVQRLWPAPLATSLFIPLWVFALQLLTSFVSSAREGEIPQEGSQAQTAHVIAGKPE